MNVSGMTSQPMYRQLRDRVDAMILDRSREGDQLASFCNVAAEYRVNPLTRQTATQPALCCVAN